MGKSRLMIGFLSALVLASCGSPQRSAENAVEVVDQSLPVGLAMPQDTQVVSRTEVSTASGEGTVVLLDSEASVETLENHFLAEAEAAGFTVAIQENSRGQRQLMGEREDGMLFDFAVAVHTDDTTRASLAVGRESTE